MPHHKISILLLQELILILLIELLQGNLSILDSDQRFPKGKDLNWSSLALQLVLLYTAPSICLVYFYRKPRPLQREPLLTTGRSEFEMADQKQPAVHVADFSDINWSSQPAALHRRHGSKIRLSENNVVAERVNPLRNWCNGVVMTAEPVTVGTVFQVTVLERVEKWSGSFVSVVMDLRSIRSSKWWFMTISQQFTRKTWNKNYSDSSSKDPNNKGTIMWGFLS